jgi:uncharacterized membrane protein
MSDKVCVAVLLCVVAGIFVSEKHEWMALFILLVAADMVSKS